MYYIKCRCNKKYTFEPKEDINVFLCSCGRKIPKSKWIEVLETEIEIEDNKSLMVI